MIIVNQVDVKDQMWNDIVDIRILKRSRHNVRMGEQALRSIVVKLAVLYCNEHQLRELQEPIMSVTN